MTFSGDTMTVQDPVEMNVCAALWTVVAYTVADLEDMLPRGWSPANYREYFPSYFTTWIVIFGVKRKFSVHVYELNFFQID